MIKEKLKQLNSFFQRINEKYRELIIGFLILSIILILLIRDESHSFNFIVSSVFMFLIVIASLIFNFIKILKPSITVPSKMIMLGINIFIILLLISYVFSLNAFLSWFGFNINDSMIIFQMLGFILFVPKITKVATKFIINRYFNEKYDDSNPLSIEMSNLVRAYAVLIIVVGYVFQTKALQYFLYNNNLT